MVGMGQHAGVSAPRGNPWTPDLLLYPTGMKSHEIPKSSRFEPPVQPHMGCKGLGFVELHRRASWAVPPGPWLVKLWTKRTTHQTRRRRSSKALWVPFLPRTHSLGFGEAVSAAAGRHLGSVESLLPLRVKCLESLHHRVVLKLAISDRLFDSMCLFRIYIPQIQLKRADS